MHATHIIISQGITTYIYTYKKGGKGYLATKNTGYIANYCLDCAPLPECGPILFANTVTLINVNTQTVDTFTKVTAFFRRLVFEIIFLKNILH